jgi:hypothetical protein
VVYRDQGSIRVTWVRAKSLRTLSAGHAFVQNLRRGHYELTADVPAHD